MMILPIYLLPLALPACVPALDKLSAHSSPSAPAAHRHRFPFGAAAHAWPRC